MDIGHRHYDMYNLQNVGHDNMDTDIDIHTHTQALNIIMNYLN